MTKENLVWLAALIDGEGSVMLNTHAGRAGKTRSGAYLRPSVIVSNNDRRLMDALIERTGVSRVYAHRRQTTESGKHPCYTWRLASDDIRRLGPKLLPHLVLKREQMELLLEFLSLPRAALGTKLTEDMVGDRIAIQTKIRALNVTGTGRN